MAQPGTLSAENFQINGQIGPKGMKSLIALQESISSWAKTYAYVEVGSFRGKSLQPHINDPDCTYALSIDLRPQVAADDRLVDITGYDLVTANDMVANLRNHCSDEELSKLEVFTGDSSAVRRRKSKRKFDLAFIDAEHTIRGAFTDFINLLPEMKTNAIIGFDDTMLILPAVEAAAAYLDHAGLANRVVYTKGGVGAILLGTYADRELIIRPRLLDPPDAAKKWYYECLGAATAN